MPRRRLEVVPGQAAGGLERAVGEYLDSVRARGGSARTDDYYTAVLTRVLLPWCEREGVKEVGDLDQRLLDRLNAELLSEVSRHTGRPLSRASVASYLRGVRQFLRWAQREGLASERLKVQQVKVPRKVLDTLSRQEIAELEAAAGSERDKLLIRILGDAGLRLGELMALRLEDLVEEGRDRYLKVTGKGSRERLVPIKPALFQRLRRYAERGRPPDCYTQRIFISLRRRPSGEYEALDPRAVQGMLKAVAVKAGISRAVNPHAFRHSMITNALRAGANPIILAKVVGHSDLSMIAGTYSHLVAADSSREMMRILVAD